jgi:transposase
MAYSEDLRERVVRAVERGDRTQQTVAEDFEVSLSFVEETWRRYRETGSCAVKVWTHGPKPKLSERSEQVRAEVATHPDVKLEQLCERVPVADGSRVSVSAMSRMLRRLKITRKKSNSMPASRRRNE